MVIDKYIAIIIVTVNMSLEYALINDTSWQSQTEWQTPDTPFMSFAFWQALTDTGAIGEQAGWLPIFILVHRVA
ncbi:peptidogalycan biosysnthesis protein, partial [Marinobacter sp. 1Y8]